MLNSELRFPYPLLRTDAEDYKTAVFTDDLDVLRETNGFRIVPRFSVNNNQIQALINANVLSYGLQIQCSSTYFRTIKYIANNEDFFIPGGLVHGQVDICPCIVALKDIDPFVMDDFVQAFQLVPVKVFTNDVVGIGTVRRFRAYYKADEVKNASSIITVKVKNDIDRISVDLSQANIFVYLPQTQFDSYLDLGTSTSDQVTMLMGLVYVPAITQALSEMDVEGNSEFADQPWYQSLLAALDKLAEGDPDKISTFIDNPFETAQMLLGDNIATTLQILKNRDW